MSDDIDEDFKKSFIAYFGELVKILRHTVEKIGETSTDKKVIEGELSNIITTVIIGSCSTCKIKKFDVDSLTNFLNKKQINGMSILDIFLSMIVNDKTNSLEYYCDLFEGIHRLIQEI